MTADSVTLVSLPSGTVRREDSISSENKEETPRCVDGAGERRCAGEDDDDDEAVTEREAEKKPLTSTTIEFKETNYTEIPISNRSKRHPATNLRRYPTMVQPQQRRPWLVVLATPG